MYLKQISVSLMVGYWHHTAFLHMEKSPLHTAHGCHHSNWDGKKAKAIYLIKSPGVDGAHYGQT